jgi:hypothetical protein
VPTAPNVPASPRLKIAPDSRPIVFIPSEEITVQLCWGERTLQRGYCSPEKFGAALERAKPLVGAVHRTARAIEVDSRKLSESIALSRRNRTSTAFRNRLH